MAASAAARGLKSHSSGQGAEGGRLAATSAREDGIAEGTCTRLTSPLPHASSRLCLPTSSPPHPLTSLPLSSSASQLLTISPHIYPVTTLTSNPSPSPLLPPLARVPLPSVSSITSKLCSISSWEGKHPVTLHASIPHLHFSPIPHSSSRSCPHLRPKKARQCVDDGLAAAPTHAPLFRVLGAMQVRKPPLPHVFSFPSLASPIFVLTSLPPLPLLACAHSCLSIPLCDYSFYRTGRVR